MDAVRAMIYCLSGGACDGRIEDGERASRAVVDANGESHWFAWALRKGEDASPMPQSETPTPFAASLSPYRPSTRDGR